MGLQQDVIVTIDVLKPTGAVTATNVLLVVEKTGGLEYKEYKGAGALDALAADYAPETNAYKMASALLSQGGRPAVLAVVAYDGTSGAAATAIRDNYNRDWYYAVLESVDTAEQIAAVTEIDSRGGKLAILRSNTVADVQALEAANLQRAHVIYTDQADEFIDAAFAGEFAAQLPGSATAKFKQLAGVSAVDVTAAEFASLEESNASTYVTKFGEDQTTGSKLLNGDFLDVVVGNDWVIARLEKGVQALYLANAKIPYDQRGANLIASEVETVMKEAVLRDIIAIDADGNPLYSVDIPVVAELTEAERATRKLSGVGFRYRLAGAVEEVEIKGEVSF